MPVYLGIDWSQAYHDACFLNAHGTIIGCLRVAHSLDGFARLDAARAQLAIPPQECWLGMETAHSLVIDWLWAHGYTNVFVLPPNAVRRARERYRQTGARTDQRDAYVIADMLRTDQQRLQPWHPDSPVTRQLRAQVSLWLQLTRAITATTNRLHAVLQRSYPAALAVFRTPNAPSSLQLVCHWPDPQSAASVRWPTFVAFARAQHYRQAEHHLRACFARLRQADPEADPAAVTAYRDEAALLAQQALDLIAQKSELAARLQRTFAAHPDAAIFESLPGTGPFLAPAL